MTRGARGELQWGRARKERGKPAAPSQAQPRPACFNGAALGKSAERGRTSGGPASPPPQLQWGRARKERGKPPRKPDPAEAYAASMGPRSERARKARGTPEDGGFGACFNGAALGKSAESCPAPGWWAASGPLQWGRARKERGKCAAPDHLGIETARFNGAALGKSAESSGVSHSRHSAMIASMGPRSERARKVIHAASHRAVWHSLQWGRARKERGKSTIPGVIPASSSLQWGRARKERGKAAYSSTSKTRRLALQWGRARKERGKRREFRRPPPPYRASMGPRSERARKVALGGRMMDTMNELQWGRARKERGKYS